MLTTVLLAVVTATATVKDLSSAELVRYYWDCDAAFMKGELSGQDLLPCIEITDELKQRVWQGDHSKFVQWWRERRHQEWGRRGYTHRPE